MAYTQEQADTRQGTPAILIVKLGALGDIVHALPALAALRSTWPDACIHWLVDAKHRALLELVEGLDEIVTITPSTIGGTFGLRPTISRLRTAQYDICFDLQGLAKSALLARASGAQRVVGFPREALREPTAGLLYTETSGRDEGHVIDKNLSLLEAVGIATPMGSPGSGGSGAFPLSTVSSPVPGVVQRLTGGRTEYVLMNPGAAWPNKRWPPECFAELARRLETERALCSVVLWGPREESLAARIERLSRGAARMAPATQLADVVAVAREATLMISGDTGPLHVAAAAGTPVVGLYGPTDPGRNGPWDVNDITLSRYGACRCHFKRRCTSAEWCLAAISVDEVEAAVVKRLAGIRNPESGIGSQDRGQGEGTG